MPERTGPAGGLAWWLNFDAPLELEFGKGYTPRAALRARARALEVPGLVEEGDLVVERDPVPAPQRLRGRAFCPTPRALHALSCAGVSPPIAPAFEVLRAVNDRAFGAALGPTLPGGAFVRDLAELERVVATTPTPTGQLWLKRSFTFAGRGHRRIDARALGEDDRRWIEAALRRSGGLAVEPRVLREADFALHGFVGRDGSAVLGLPTAQRTSPQGSWLGSRLAASSELEPWEVRALFEEAEAVARALSTAGYFGPFGIDAFRYRDARGQQAFAPRCDVNARYTMGWALGMAGRRPDRAADEAVGGR